jgi:hypothetical protein
MTPGTRPSIEEEYIGELPDDCRECGEKCSKTERAICLRELCRRDQG